MVVAVVVHGTLAVVEEQAVLAGLERQRAVGALVELVAVRRVRVQLQALGFHARVDLEVLGRQLAGQLAACRACPSRNAIATTFVLSMPFRETVRSHTRNTSLALGGKDVDRKRAGFFLFASGGRLSPLQFALSRSK